METELKGFYEIFYGEPLESLLKDFNLESFIKPIKNEELEINDIDLEPDSFEQISQIWNYSYFDFESIFYQLEAME
jgi:hypothetical protein